MVLTVHIMIFQGIKLGALLGVINGTLKEIRFFNINYCFWDAGNCIPETEIE